MRLVKTLGWVLLGFVLLVLLAGGALWFGGGRVVAWMIEYPGSAVVGRQIRIGGPLSVRWGEPTLVSIEDVHIANASWGSAPEMFQAKRLEVELFPRTLLLGPIRIPRLSFDGAKLLLETSGEGVGNWKINSIAPKKRDAFPDLHRLVVHDVTLIYRNGQTQARSQLDIASLDYAAPDRQSAVKAALDGKFQNQPLRLAATVGPLAELRDTAHPYPVSFDGALAHVRLTAEGTLKEPLDFNGVDMRLSFSGAKLHELAATLGVPLPELPDFRGTGELTGGDDDWALNAISLKLGSSDLEGGIAVDARGKVPRIEGNFTSAFLDIGDFKGLYGGTPAHTSAPVKKPPALDGHVIPDAKIAVEKLPGVNAVLHVYGANIRSTGGLPLERVTLGLRLENGELALKPLNFHVADGDVTLNLHFNPFTADGPPRLKGGVDVRHVDLHKLVRDTKLSDVVKRSAGNVGGFVTVDARGASLREFLASADGDVGLFMENGQISALMEELAPIDVLGVLGVYVAGDRPVPIDCFISRFEVKRGVATATTFLLKSHDTSVLGAGTVNFGSEMIDLKLSPYNNRFTIVSLRTPVDIRGTLAQPDYHIESAGIIKRLGAALGLGALFPPAALLPLVDTGLGEGNSCAKAYAAQNPKGNPAPKNEGGAKK